MDEAPTGRRRRQSDEVDALIIDAAREMFAAKGYVGASSREIASLAGVHEPLIYRRFGTKAGLFEAAVVVPLNQAISSYLAGYESQLSQPSSIEELTRSFIAPVYTLVKDHRELLIALLSVQQFNGDAETRGWDLDSVLQRMDGQAEVEMRRRGLGLPKDDPGLNVRVTVGMVLGMVLTGDWLLGTDRSKRSDEVILNEMIRLSAYGVEHREASAPGPSATSVAVRGDEPEGDLPSRYIDHLLDRLAEAEGRAVVAEFKLAERELADHQRPTSRASSVIEPAGQ